MKPPETFFFFRKKEAKKTANPRDTIKINGVPTIHKSALTLRHFCFAKPIASMPRRSKYSRELNRHLQVTLPCSRFTQIAHLFYNFSLVSDFCKCRMFYSIISGANEGGNFNDNELKTKRRGGFPRPSDRVPFSAEKEIYRKNSYSFICGSE